MPAIDLADPDLWNRLRQQAADLVESYQAAYEEGGEVGPDAAWRALTRDILVAVTDSFDGDQVAAAGALAQALREVVTGSGALTPEPTGTQ